MPQAWRIVESQEQAATRAVTGSAVTPRVPFWAGDGPGRAVRGPGAGDGDDRIGGLFVVVPLGERGA